VATRPHLLLVTDDTSLELALRSILEGWQVSSRPVTGDSLAADVAVLELGSTAAGVQALMQAGEQPRLGALVLGARPYSLPDLADAIRTLVDRQPPGWLGTSASDEEPPANWEATSGLPSMVGRAATFAPSEPIAPAVDLAGPQPATDDRRHWLLRLARGVASPEQQLRQRIDRAVATLADVEAITSEIPLLSEPARLARFVVDDLAGRFDGQSVGLWRRVDDGWRVLACRGFTTYEAAMLVPSDQLLFAALERSRTGQVVPAIDVQQATVAGIGGAHTESFMAAPVVITGRPLGIVAVGCDRELCDGDLRQLTSAADEIAALLALTWQLQRLWAAAPAKADAVEPKPERSWRPREQP
jgi:hypothetical protein